MRLPQATHEPIRDRHWPKADPSAIARASIRDDESGGGHEVSRSPAGVGQASSGGTPKRPAARTSRLCARTADNGHDQHEDGHQDGRDRDVAQNARDDKDSS